MKDDVSKPLEPTLALVLGDFGRDAALRFCSRLAAAERARVRAELGPETLFFDEHRLMTLCLVGDLQYIKREALAAYRRDGRPLDNELLVGFPGGPRPAGVTARLGVLALEALQGPFRRGLRRALVLLPCNTLAPTAWSLEERLGAEASRTGLELLDEAGAAPWAGLAELLAAIEAGTLELRFPTVPDAVLRLAALRGAAAVQPWGTEDIEAVYREAAARSGSPVRCATVSDGGRAVVLEAIKAAIDGSADRRAAALIGLEALAAAAEEDRALAVEACTDLDYARGLDSLGAYVELVVDLVYGVDEGLA